MNRRKVRTWAAKTGLFWNVRSSSMNSKIREGRGLVSIRGLA